jgi:hypothetical protein
MNLQTQLAKRRAEKLYREGGWGPQLTFPVKRAAGKPLVFQCRLPNGLALIEVQKLAAAARGAPTAVGKATTALERAGEAAGVIVVGALCPPRASDAELEVLATMTVALADVKGPPNPEDFMLAETERSTQEVTKISDKATMIRRLSVESLDQAQEPVPMLVVQYLLESQFGALVWAFSTTHHEMFGQWARDMYAKVVETGWIGTKPRPY